jgi:signal peptidase
MSADNSSLPRQNKNLLRSLVQKGRAQFNSFSNHYASSAWIPLLLSVGAMYYITNSSILRNVDTNLRFYLIMPLLWIFVSLLAWWGWKYGLDEKPSINKFLMLISIAIGIAHILTSLLFGLIFRFGNSPYTHSFPYVLGNAFFVITYLIGLEFSRAYFLARTTKRKPLLSFLVIAIIYTVLVIPLGFYSKLTEPKAIFIGFGQTLMPQFSMSLLATYLAWVGGPIAALSYGLIVTLFEWLSPILPNLSWMVTAFLETLTPMVLLLIANQLIIRQDDKESIMSDDKQEHIEEKKQPSYLWVGVAALGVALVWFNMGIFGVRPYLVSGVSMQPTLNAGDVVIIEGVPPHQIKVGDVILFKGLNVHILHRVIEINPKSGELEFITQGDGLNTIDDPVSETQIEGKMIANVPKIGWVAIGVRRALGYDQVPMP